MSGNTNTPNPKVKARRPDRAQCQHVTIQGQWLKNAECGACGPLEVIEEPWD